MTTAVIALVCGQDWHFLSHRLSLAKAAQAAGLAVLVVVPPGDRVEDIRRLGFMVETIPLSRNMASPWRDLVAVWMLMAICRRHRVSVAHAFALKPILVSALATFLLPRPPALVATLSGLGYLFINDGGRARIVRRIFSFVLSFLLRRLQCRLIVQNADDREVAKSLVADERIEMVRGSGVDTQIWCTTPEPENGVPIAVLPARMLWDKGVGEFVAAGRLLRARGVPVRLALVGDSDPGNPRSIPRDQLAAWAAEGAVEWWGHQSEMRDVWAKAHIAVLPSYREGLPKALLEAAACGRALIATDVPGCRELVRHGKTGLQVPARQAHALADSIEWLARSDEERRRLATAARQVVETDYSSTVINDAILTIYSGMLAAWGP